MRILLLSDTHGEETRTRAVLQKHQDVDAIYHLGDVGPNDRYLGRIPIVCGNHDNHKYPMELLLELQGYRTLLTHGHSFEYTIVEQMSKQPDLWKDWNQCLELLYDEMVKYAKVKQLDMILFGHTHTAHFEQRDGIYLCNPGSLCFSRDGSCASYAILTIDKQVSAQFYFLEEESV